MFETLPAQVHLALLAAPAPQPDANGNTVAPSGGSGVGPNANINAIEQWLADNPVRAIMMVCGIFIMAQFRGGKMAKTMGSVGVLLLGLVIFFAGTAISRIGQGLAGLL